MKKFNKKSLALLIAAALLLTITVSGTVAYLVDSTGSLVNTFTPTEVETTIDENVVEGSKNSIAIRNTGNIPVYVRVAIVANWVDSSGNIVAPWTGTIDYNQNEWGRDSSGYYFYRTALAVGATTNPQLLHSAITQGTIPEGADHLEVTVLHQSIQAEGTTSEGVKAVVDAWGYDPSMAY